MRFVPIARAVPGMVLSKTLFDAEHRLLLGANMELTEDFIRKLMERGLPGFYIEDELTKDIVVSEAITEKLRGEAVECLVKGDIDATVKVVQRIVEQLRNSDVISLDLIDLRTFDEYTYRHSVNVAVLATIVGIGLSLTNENLIELCTAAILHDIGKLLIDPSILNKPSRLTEEEYTIMRNHSQMSYDIIKNKLEVSAKTKVGVLYHHENMDGTGYPKALKGDDIHQYARIIHIVDVYDALTTARPYKSAYSPLESVEYLLGGSGIMFDPEIVKTFVKFVPIYPKGVTVVLSNGEEAIIVENHMQQMTRPIIRTLDGKTIDLANDMSAMNLTIVRVLDNSYAFVKGRGFGTKDERKHILVVDDMIVNLKVVQGILEENYRVSVARNSQQAFRFLYRKRPDLILLDIDMPDMNGIDLAHKIHKDIDGTIPIIFVTALSGRNVVMQSKQADAQDYILKPFKSLFLLDRVSRVLQEEQVII